MSSRGTLGGVSKRVLQRYFFEFKVPISWKKAENVVNVCIANTYGNGPEHPVAVEASTLLAIKRALEACRKREGKSTSRGLQAESALLEAAADKGHPAAVALLSGARFHEDQEAASRLLCELMDRNFPLAFKVSGDIAYKIGQQAEAKRFWELALESGLKDDRQRIECWRGIAHVAFRDTELIEARDAFMNACSEAATVDPGSVADCHFYLAQLREADREVARSHLEVAAGFGLSDAYIPLGQLLLNWFGEARLASEYFWLALATDKTGRAAIGMLDAALRLGDVPKAKEALSRAQRLEAARPLVESRRESLHKAGIEIEVSSQQVPPTPLSPSSQANYPTSAGSRWEL